MDARRTTAIPMDEQPGKSFLGQLKQRKVFRVAVAYAVVGWIMMQVGEVTFEALGLPPWALTLLLVTVLLGFPIALVLAWIFEVTPDGVQKDSAGESGKETAAGTSRVGTGSPGCCPGVPGQDIF